MTSPKYVKRHLSFGENTEALRAGKMTVTREPWGKSWARRWKKGDHVIAYDKNPARDGSQVALLQLTEDAYLENGSGLYVVRFEKVLDIVSDLEPTTGRHDHQGASPDAECYFCGQIENSPWHKVDRD